jgi:hypothetical protein
MSELISYTYTVLRYVHDISTGEFVNVGVVLHAPQAAFLQAKMRSTYGRLTRVFPDVDGEAFKRTMSRVEDAIANAGERLGGLFPDPGESVMAFAARALARDDSSLQWSPLGSGRTRDPSQELERLFDKLVLRYERSGGRESSSDADVWKEFCPAFQRRQLLTRLERKEIVSDVDCMTFDHAWKNSKWHCLQPVSFDLSESESIHLKATRWLGQMAALAGASDPFKVYLLVGEPRRAEVRSDYEKALRILQKIPVSNEIVPESAAEDLAIRIEADMRRHERRS